MSPAGDMSGRHGTIGTQMPRIDGALKVAGKARFAAEIPLEGMLFGALTFSTCAKGRIASLDTEAAETAPGVVLVMTCRNAPALRPAPYFHGEREPAGFDLPVMQDETIRWNGQPIALVLAETQEQADNAASLIRATYDREPAVTSFEAAKAAGLHPGHFAGRPLNIEIGDAERALAAAPFKVDAVYRTPQHNHNAIEPHAVTVAWDGDWLRVHSSTQSVTHIAWALAHTFRLSEDQVHVTSPYVGGGFGGKAMCRQELLAAAAAKLAGRPVRLALSREGVYRLIGGRARAEQRVAIAAQSSGRFEAIIHTGIAAMTDHHDMAEPFVHSSRTLYGARCFKQAVSTAFMDMPANSFMRAPGEAIGSFAVECTIDELACEMGIDPIDLRLMNEPAADPLSGRPFSSRHLAEAYRLGAERFGWRERDATPGTRREGEWLVGIGCASATYPYVRMPGGAARLTLSCDGRVALEIAAHEMGMGTATAHTQIVAERMGIVLDKVRFVYGDSALPGVVLAGASQQTASIGASFLAAQRGLVTELLRLAGNRSPLSGLTADEVRCSDGGLWRIDDPACGESYEAILGRAGRQEVTVVENAPPPAEMGRWSIHSYGAMFCEVRVNTVTGETRVGRFLGAFDCGRILNARTAASQLRGGIIMGLGLALMEETLFDERSGRIMNPSLADYHLPVHLDVPDIDLLLLEHPDPNTPLGSRGIGEIGITGVGAAVANAVYNATGKRVRSLPITLDALL